MEKIVQEDFSSSDPKPSSGPQHKVRTFVLRLLISVCLVSFSSLIHANTQPSVCGAEVGRSSHPRALKPLIEKMNLLELSFELNFEQGEGGRFEPYFEIFAKNPQGEVVGEISMVSTKTTIVIDGTEKSLFTSHPDVTTHPTQSMKRTGLGTFLYAAAARVIHRVDGILFSSTGPSPEAELTWLRMLQSGWAVIGTERDQELSEIRTLGGNLPSFRFDQELLQSGFFDSIDNQIEDPGDILDWFESLN